MPEARGLDALPMATAQPPAHGPRWRATPSRATVTPMAPLGTRNILAITLDLLQRVAGVTRLRRAAHQDRTAAQATPMWHYVVALDHSYALRRGHRRARCQDDPHPHPRAT